MHAVQRVSGKELVFTPLALNRLIEWLDEGIDSQGERYLDMHRRLVAYFDRRNRPGPEGLADETFRRIAATLERTGVIETTPPARYCYVMAKFVLLEDIRREGTPLQVDEACATVAARPASVTGVDDGVTSGEQQSARLDRCLQELRADERELIVEVLSRCSAAGDRAPRSNGGAHGHQHEGAQHPRLPYP